MTTQVRDIAYMYMYVHTLIFYFNFRLSSTQDYSLIWSLYIFTGFVTGDVDQSGKVHIMEI